MVQLEQASICEGYTVPTNPMPSLNDLFVFSLVSQVTNSCDTVISPMAVTSKFSWCRWALGNLYVGVFDSTRYTKYAHNMLYSVFSLRIFKARTGGDPVGVACGHIKAFRLFPLPHQSQGH